jgi:uncharacterized protein YkwD
MRRSRLITAVTLLAFSSILAGADLSTWSKDELTGVELINQQRQHRGLSPLLPDDRLHAAAKAHAQDMAERNYFSHVTPEPEAWTYQDRITAAGYHWDQPSGSAAENISSGLGRYQDPRSVMFGTPLIDDLIKFAKKTNLSSPINDWPDVGRGWNNENWRDWARAQKASNAPGGWMGSDGHRDNILGAGFSHIGVGYAVIERGGRFHHYWTVTLASGD